MWVADSCTVWRWVWGSPSARPSAYYFSVVAWTALWLPLGLEGAPFCFSAFSAVCGFFWSEAGGKCGLSIPFLDVGVAGGLMRSVVRRTLRGVHWLVEL